jgi:AcrR family transcriptional regulator
MTKREKILAAALHLFNENGFAKTPTSRISREAGVATGTLFHHFKTKEDLINSLYLEIETQLIEEARTWLERAEGTKDKFHNFWQGYVSWAMKNRRRYQFIIQFCESPYITSLIKQKVEDMENQLCNEPLEEGKKLGILRPLPNDLIKSLADGILQQTICHFMDNPDDLKDKALVGEMFEVFWCAFASSEKNPK